MCIKLRLTVAQDLSLLTLSSIPEFDFRQWVEDSLLTYITTGETLKTPTPHVPGGLNLRRTTVNLTFNEQNGAIIENWLRHVRPDYRSLMIKIVLWNSLTVPCLTAFYKNYS